MICTPGPGGGAVPGLACHLAATGIRYPKVSRETLARLKADLIIDSSGAAQQSMTAWPKRDGQTVGALPTSAATPRPDVQSSLKRVSALVLRASKSAAAHP